MGYDGKNLRVTRVRGEERRGGEGRGGEGRGEERIWNDFFAIILFHIIPGIWCHYCTICNDIVIFCTIM